MKNKAFMALLVLLCMAVADSAPSDFKGKYYVSAKASRLSSYDCCEACLDERSAESCSDYEARCEANCRQACECDTDPPRCKCYDNVDMYSGDTAAALELKNLLALKK